MNLEPWKPLKKMTPEDYILLKYLNTVGGITFSEVIVGHGGVHEWPPGSKPRRIDAVRVPNSDYKEIVTFKRGVNGKRFKVLVTGKKVEVIEVKRKLSRLVIGKSIIGADMLDLDYQPYSIKQVILCEIGDPLLEMICDRRGIKVWKAGD
jgi:hypothetical protein